MIFQNISKLPPIAFACIFFLRIYLPVHAGEAFEIEHLQVDIEVAENNEYQIREELDLVFTQSRHGLIRKIPLKFDQNWVSVSDVKVQGYDFAVSKNGNNCEIKIGSKDETVQGDVHYTIEYKYEVGADTLPDMDEFNHNVVGVEWDSSIASVEFRILLPKAFDSDKVNCTLGRYGSTNNSDVEWSVDGNIILGQTKRPLQSFEGLTVAIPLPEGYWVNARKNTRPTTNLFKILSYPLYGLVAFISTLIWFLKGRDRRLFPTVEFSAPEGMTPAEIGYIIDGSVDPKDITSLILYWADKGHLQIEEHSEENGKKITSMSLTKVSELGPEAKSFERFVFRKLFTGDKNGVVTTEDLKNEFYKTINQATIDIQKHFEGNPDRAVYKASSTGWKMLVGFLSMLPIIAILLDLFTPLSGKGPLWILAIVLSVLFLIPNLFAGRVISRQHTWRKTTVILILLGIMALYGIAGFLIVNVAGVHWLQYASAAASSFISACFVSIVAKRTEYGDQITEKVLGFREFIKTAELDRINTLFKENPSYFYNILPYALVLGLSDIWSRHFKKIKMSPPSWYRGYYYDDFDTRDFTHRLGSSMSYMNHSMTSAPSSSGSSGSSSSGGYSGGGSGGGGGSSW